MECVKPTSIYTSAEHTLWKSCYWIYSLRSLRDLY